MEPGLKKNAEMCIASKPGTKPETETGTLFGRKPGTLVCLDTKMMH
jgi:hypothetical protein